MRNTWKIVIGSPEGNRPVGRTGIDWRIILK
jgi:hypothetical protein